MRTILIAFILSGCILEPGQWDFPNAPVHAVALDPSQQTRWEAMVANSTDQWNLLLAERGCLQSFHMASSGNEVTLIPPDRWPNGPEAVGMEWYQHIEILARRNDDGVVVFPENNIPLLHELGHALGLHHITDRPSIMNLSGAASIFPEDVQAAAVEIGCTPN